MAFLIDHRIPLYTRLCKKLKTHRKVTELSILYFMINVRYIFLRTNTNIEKDHPQPHYVLVIKPRSYARRNFQIY